MKNKRVARHRSDGGIVAKQRVFIDYLKLETGLEVPAVKTPMPIDPIGPYRVMLVAGLG